MMLIAMLEKVTLLILLLLVVFFKFNQLALSHPVVLHARRYPLQSGALKMPPIVVSTCQHCKASLRILYANVL